MYIPLLNIVLMMIVAVTGGGLIGFILGMARYRGEPMPVAELPPGQYQIANETSCHRLYVVNLTKRRRTYQLAVFSKAEALPAKFRVSTNGNITPT